MGMKLLANGIEYYSVVEELKVFSDEIFQFLASLSSAWFLLVFSVFMAFFIVYVMIYVRMVLNRMAT